MSDQARTEDDLLRTFRDVTDPGYAEPLEQSAGAGWDSVAGEAAVVARASQAIETNSQAFFLLPSSRQTAPSASGATHASATLSVTRKAGFSAFAVLVPVGKAVVPTLRDSRGQPATLEAYQLGEAINLGVANLGPVLVQAVATRPGDQANLRTADSIALGLEGRRTVALSSIVGMLLTDTGIPDVFTAGDVGRYLLIAGEGIPRRVSSYSQDALGRGQVTVEGSAITGAGTARLLEWSELGLVIALVTPFAGGTHATLDQIGADRGMPRGPGESDLDYAYRVSSLPDVVSPAALRRIIAQHLSPIGIAWDFHETRDPELRGFVLDSTPLDAATACDNSWPWSGAVLLNDNASKRFFAVCVEPNNNLGRYGLFRDCANAGINYYDCAVQGADGGTPGYDNAMATLAHDLDTARAGGVDWALLERTAYVPITFRTVTLTVTLTASTAPYLAARDAALLAFFQLLAPGEATREVMIVQAISNALLLAGLNPSAFVSTSDSLTPAGLREKLVYALAP